MSRVHAHLWVHNDNALHQIAQFAHIAQPAMFLQNRVGSRSQLLGTTSVRHGESPQETVGQQRHIFNALAQKRKVVPNKLKQGCLATAAWFLASCRDRSHVRAHPPLFWYWPVSNRTTPLFQQNRPPVVDSDHAATAAFDRDHRTRRRRFRGSVSGT